MQQKTGNFNFSDGNERLQIALFSDIGDRDEQQDSLGYELCENGGVFVVCDGMGGLFGGSIASKAAVDVILRTYLQNSAQTTQGLIDGLVNADKTVAEMCDENGKRLGAGSTAVAAVIKDNYFYWASAGDSRIYFIRNGQITRVTEDHNYFLVLNRKLESGEITMQQYDVEKKRGAALISFLGINGLPLVNRSNSPLQLQSGDYILLTSDGLFNLLSDEEICNIILSNEEVRDAVEFLVIKSRRNAKAKNKKRDNVTMSLIKIM